MKPHPRIRKTIKWGGAAVTVLLVVVWIGSWWWYVGRSGPTCDVAIMGGHFLMRTHSDWFDPSVWWCRVASPTIPWRRDWLFQGKFDGTNQDLETGVSLWPVAAASFVATVAAWRIDTLARRRAKLNLCAKCGYDRTGILKDAKCPECGAVPASV